ncbi:MAG: pyruvate:ferredoxin (flavodoxin) oxidoreductase [Prevotellaceae bacterium]|jgi:pyruvate-ferredoxin/flavodoxin oxidoreductase|nr:pyruvate:ferredoxin (flavodoxin) oxidoreductase [Prevotellaceae bacterium]
MAKEKKFVTCDGNYAAAHVAYMFSEVAAIYPITPSSTMAEYVDEWAAFGKKNLFGEAVKVTEMQSEAGAAGAVHGSLQAGALTTTFTASQGLLLMVPNMYKIAGELLPCVFHVSARALAMNALSIFGDHSDVMATRQTGFAMLAAGGVQEVMDLSAVSHLAALKGRVPFVSFFDGFRTSHEIQKIEAIDGDDLRSLIDQQALTEFRLRALNPNAPVTRGTAQNGDVYFQAREASNRYYDALPDLVAGYMREISRITGRDYKPFNYYGAPDAENIIVAMGSVCDTIKECIDYLNAQGKRYGAVFVHLYRPFSVKHLSEVVPGTVKRIAVLDRTKEPGANGSPLYLDVVEAFASRKATAAKPLVVGGRYGLSSKDTTPAQIIAVYENLEAKEPKNGFTIGIVDDVTFLSLPQKAEISVGKAGTFEAKFYGLGSDGTVGANKNTIKIIGDATPKYCQAYFAYDSKKSGGFTCSHLRFGDAPINSPYLVNTPDFVACHVPSYLSKYDILRGIKPGGTFLLNSLWDAEETKKRLPDFVKRALAEKHINLYVMNATKIAEEIGLGNRTNTILQSAFFKIAAVIPYEEAVKQMKKFIEKSYGKKGEDVVKKNYAAVDRGGEVVKVDVPAEWATLTAAFAPDTASRPAPDFVKKVADVVNAQIGDDLPVSAFVGQEDGTIPCGTAAYEKRGIAVHVPQWTPENCIQCNQCSYICPHAAIRPYLLTEAELAAAPAGLQTVKGNGAFKEYNFRVQVSPLDCTGCGNCADVCPAKTKALAMQPAEGQLAEQAHFDHLHAKVGYKDTVANKYQTMKNSQFAQPLFEFSGACAGCGETPYVKALTQLFGERMMIANATGCSSIYGGSFPASPYCTNKNGQGPAWANSLFEDNAEFGLGMDVASERLRDRLEFLMKKVIAENPDCGCKEGFEEWIDNRSDARKTQEIAPKLIAGFQEHVKRSPGCPDAKELLTLSGYLVKRSQWIIGGDGWAYDIGYGGLDHVLASGHNVNILVLDTEVYSNTGGQSSKSTPAGAVAKFATSGKRVRKKDLGMMAMSYGYVYVAQVAMGASHNQLFNALKEAEAHNGPSLVIAYAPCINHGLKGGMSITQREEKAAVECGYWHTYRYNPALEAEGKNPFALDSKEPDWSKFQDYLKSEVRFSSLQKSFPEAATELFKVTEDNAKWRYNQYRRLAGVA